jgi:hypothetical protein
LYYYNARYYDPTIGRFISADTFIPNFSNPQNLNRYTYCNNNPVKFTDPTGHLGWLAAIGIGALVGAFVGVVKYTVYDYGVRHDDWNWRKLAGNAAAGAITGALCVIPGGNAFISGACATVIGDIAGNGFVGGQPITPAGLALDIGLGGTFNSIGSSLSPVIGKVWPTGYEGMPSLLPSAIDDILTANIILGPIGAAISSVLGDKLMPQYPSVANQVNEAPGYSFAGCIYDTKGNWIGYE